MAHHTYKHPRPMVSVDAVIAERVNGRIGLLLIERGTEPHKGKWALPGGFVEMEEDLEPAARRELLEETGVEAEALLQVGAFGDPKRDPRGRNISIAFAGVVTRELGPQGGDDAARARVFDLDELPQLAFDHDIIVKKAILTLKSAGWL